MAFKQLIIFSTILVLYFRRTLSQGHTKIWTTGEEKFLNFEKDDSECVNQTFIYQRYAGIYFNVPEEINTLILPSDGSIIFPQNHEIRFIPRKLKCHSENYEAKHFKLQLNHPMSWFDPDHWQIKDKHQNKATPDIDRIPCECDIVEFPSNHSLWIDLDFVPQMTVKQVKLNDKIDNFNSFLETSLGQSMFVMFDGSFKEGLCNEPKSCGCHEAEKFEKYFNLVCLNADVCKTPHCVDPIQPIGFCCPICGATLTLVTLVAVNNNSYCKSKEDVNDAFAFSILHLNDGKYANTVDTYVGIVQLEDNTEMKTQIVAVDKEEYNEISVELIRLLASMTPSHLNHIVRVAYSGRPYKPNSSISSVWFIIFGSLFIVLTMFGSIYAYYTDDSKLRKYNPFNRFRLFTPTFVFARFDNNRDGDTESIAVGVEFENPNPSTTIYETIASAFDNPMFKGRNKEKKIETIGPNVLNECANDEDDDGESITSVKLVAVDLDSNEETI